MENRREAMGARHAPSCPRFPREPSTDQLGIAVCMGDGRLNGCSKRNQMDYSTSLALSTPIRDPASPKTVGGLLTSAWGLTLTCLLGPASDLVPCAVATYLLVCNHLLACSLATSALAHFLTYFLLRLWLTPCSASLYMRVSK